MKKAKAVTSSKSSRKMRPALTPEARENQMISLAVDLAEQQLRDGTASSQVITHYLKLGSTKERIEKEILEKQKELIEAKTQSLQSAQRIEELYTNALDAMRKYSGRGSSDD
jgi:EAL domain-containing protein (putative c-di-GMP-specific phosphodiesterase class I)